MKCLMVRLYSPAVDALLCVRCANCAEMYDIATQLVLKWSRYGPEHDIKVTDDFTRLTLDSIAL